MRTNTTHNFAISLALMTLLSAAHPVATAEDKPDAAGADAAALAVLDTGRRAYNEGKFDVSIERFREFLKQNAQKKEGSAAQYGLAISLLELAQKDYAGALAALQLVVAQPKAPERPFAFYYLASIQRTQGLQALEQAIAKPNEAANLRTSATQQFAEATKNFASAADGFAEQAKGQPAAEGGGPSPEQEWMLRSRCDQCDMLLRADKNKEAAELAQSIANDKTLAKNPLRLIALYHLGCASFDLKDTQAAGRALGQLAPFDQPFGAHARFLLSRIHHLAGETPEAGTGYKAILTDYDALKKAAGEAMKNPGALRVEDRLRFEALLKPAPDYIVRATFYNSLILAEAGEFGDAMGGFTTFVQQYPSSSFIEEARLRQGFCLVQVKNFAEAVKVLTPLQTHAALGDRAMWWLARAQASAADPAKPPEFVQAVKGAVDLLGKAAEKAAVLGQSDPEAKSRRGDILLEQGDTQQLGGLYKEAAATYEKVCSEYGTTERAEQAMERQVTALHLGGMYKESEELCQKFEKTYPKSILLAAVWFRSADNGCMAAMAIANDPKATPESRAGLDKKFDDAISRYQRLMEKYPEFAYVNLARYGMGSAQYQRGQYDVAFTTLSSILDADRSGELATVNYLLGDSLIRQFPTETNDALQAAKLLYAAEQGARLLEKYASSQGKTPQAADAWLKLGHCYLRVGMLVVDPAERQKTLTQARQVFEKLMAEHGNTPSMPAAVLERAHCMALQGDVGGAMNEYNRFNGDPLKQSPIAPLAMMRQAALMRTQNQFPNAVNLMADCRKRYEEALKKDPLRSDWVAQIQYEHALAIKDSGKPAEARAIFEGIVKQFEKRPEAVNSMWRAAQCRREELQVALSAAYALQKKPGAKPEEIAAATKTIDESLAAFKQTADALKTEAAKKAPIEKGTDPKAAKAAAEKISEAQLRMLYEAAWCYRALADTEIEAARQKLTAARLQKVLENLKKAAPTQPVPALSAPSVPLSEVAVQPSEKDALEQYQAILTLAPASLISQRARLELAELQAQRGQNDAALDLLATAIEDNPALELTERLRLRIATCLIAKDDTKTALIQIQAVTKNAASSQMGEALFLAGECYIQNKDWPNAIAQFVNFRDKDPFRNMNVLTERALLRLAHAQAQAQKWDESRQALEQLVQRFGQSPLVPEARFGIGAAWQKANQHDNAYNAFMEVTRRTAAEIAAQAQLEMGKVRLAQKRYPDALKELLAVPAVYDYPELSAEALCEAGQAYLEQNQPAEATKVLQGVVKDYGASKWAETAKKRLAGIK